MKALVIGNGAREHVIAETLKRSTHKPEIVSYMKANNPGIAALSTDVRIGSYGDLAAIVDFARKRDVRFAIVGPEDPLERGVVDALLAAGIPSVGPIKICAQLETSKVFTRKLLEKYNIPGNPRFRIFGSLDGIADFMKGLENVVIKPDGLTGGKGVMVQGDHFGTKNEAMEKCRAILAEHGSVIVEEKFDGEEFSLQCFCDGTTVAASPPVQDHKRRFAGDKGPNTGGMGSYSMEQRLLPFMTDNDLQEGLRITEQVARAIQRETGSSFKGIMYGGFIITAKGVKLLEYNARFGDPEAMNILPLLTTDFVDLCMAIIEGTLHDCPVNFDNKASVCKYVVPKGYGLPSDHPDAATTAAKIEISDASDVQLYFASVDRRDDGLYMSSSRAVGVVGIAENLAEAERRAEGAIGAIRGPVDHRADIGTAELIARRVEHMNRIRNLKRS
ncbi:MAG: phosphoribosylamine--glycine ligase [Deltaproteobacteria bacterium]|nr:phosphoribosylamine--glycine ligase [Deltaproteobacteria bacterium]